MAACPQFLVDDWTLSLSMISPGEDPRKCAHLTSCDGLEPIWRSANSSGVKQLIKILLCTGPGQVTLQSWHSIGTRSIIAIAAVFWSLARARMVSALTLRHDGQRNCNSALNQCCFISPYNGLVRRAGP